MKWSWPTGGFCAMEKKVNIILFCYLDYMGEPHSFFRAYTFRIQPLNIRICPGSCFLCRQEYFAGVGNHVLWSRLYIEEVGEDTVTILNINKITAGVQLENATTHFKLRCWRSASESFNAFSFEISFSRRKSLGHRCTPALPYLTSHTSVVKSVPSNKLLVSVTKQVSWSGKAL